MFHPLESIWNFNGYKSQFINNIIIILLLPLFPFILIAYYMNNMIEYLLKMIDYKILKVFDDMLVPPLKNE
jgi:hypothetical protein